MNEHKMDFWFTVILYLGLPASFLRPDIFGNFGVHLRSITLLVCLTYFIFVTFKEKVLDKQLYDGISPKKIINIIRGTIIDFKNKLISHNFNEKFDVLLVLSLFFYFLFIVFLFISDLYHLELPIKSIAHLFISLPVFIIIIPKRLKYSLEHFLEAAKISGLVYIIISIIVIPISLDKFYKGIMLNPNQLGFIASQVTISSFCLLLFQLKIKAISIKDLFNFILLIFSFVVLLLTKSRTSFLSSLIPIVVILLLILYKQQLSLKYYFMIFITFLIAYRIKLGEILDKTIFLKFSQNSMDLLNGRGGIWKKILERPLMLGHGKENIFSEIGLHGHNIFLQYFEIHGLIVSLFLFLFFLTLLIWSVKKLYFVETYYEYIYFILFSSFFIMNLFEIRFGSVGISLTLLFYNTIGIALYRNTRIFDRKKEYYV